MVNICPLLLIHLLLQLNNLHLFSITLMKQACVFVNTCSPLYCNHTVLTFYFLNIYFMTYFTSLCDVCLRLAKQPIPTVSKSFSHLLKIDNVFSAFRSVFFSQPLLPWEIKIWIKGRLCNPGETCRKCHLAAVNQETTSGVQLLIPPCNVITGRKFICTLFLSQIPNKRERAVSDYLCGGMGVKFILKQHFKSCL